MHLPRQKDRNQKGALLERPTPSNKKQICSSKDDSGGFVVMEWFQSFRTVRVGAIC